MARRWKSLKVPAEIHGQIKELRERLQRPAWQVIAEALSFYESMIRKYQHFSRASEMDKLAYYIVKLISSASYFKMSPTKESMDKFLQVVGQLEKRLGVKCEELRPLAEKLLRDKNGKAIHGLNMGLKMCVLRLMERMVSSA